MRKPAQTLVLLLAAASFLGCVDDLDSVLRTGGDSSGPRCSSDDDAKTWTLGTGRIEDIKRLSPKFFGPRNGAWRRAGLSSNMQGVSEIRAANVDGAEAFEFITRDVPYRVRAVRIDNKVAILATPAQCPQVAALDRCIDDRLRTEIRVAGTAACLGPISVPRDRVTITMGSNEYMKEELVFGTPLLETTNSDSISFAIHLKGSKDPAGHVERRVNDFSKALPDEVVAFLRVGYEGPAAMLWRNVPGELKTPEVLAEVAKARAEGVAVAVSSVASPRGVNDLIKSHPFGLMPGDAETKRAIVAKIHTLVDELVRAEPKPETLFDIALYFRLSEPLTSERPDVSLLETKYGPLLKQAGYSDPKVQGSFMVLLPASKFTKALEVEEAKENQPAEVEAKKQAANADLEQAWIETQGRGDEIATLMYKIRFGRQNFSQTRHKRRGLEQMEKYRAGLVRDAFCPAKRAFVSQGGVAEYNRRAADHCAKEPPTDVGVGGAEKVLTAECRAAFASGC